MKAIKNQKIKMKSWRKGRRVGVRQGGQRNAISKKGERKEGKELMQVEGKGKSKKRQNEGRQEERGSGEARKEVRHS